MDLRALLPVQAVDQRIAQLQHKRAQLPEHAVAAAAQRALDAARAEEKRLAKRQGDITGEIDRLEMQGKDLDAKKKKYETQLKNVVVMREVEALQHEISTIAAQHSSLDDNELALMSENETLEASLAANAAAMPGLEAAAAQAASALTAVLEVVDRDLAAANEERAKLTAAADTAAVELYESTRKRVTGPAVAELLKGSCGGCRTPITPKEQAEIKSMANTPDARCLYCGCLLVV
ncbi:MAG: zinc ribbon domain-containing protein [Ilumatobacteraceae bacterium]